MKISRTCMTHTTRRKIKTLITPCRKSDSNLPLLLLQGRSRLKGSNLFHLKSDLRGLVLVTASTSSMRLVPHRGIRLNKFGLTLELPRVCQVVQVVLMVSNRIQCTKLNKVFEVNNNNKLCPSKIIESTRNQFTRWVRLWSQLRWGTKEATTRRIPI
jgi:hypothetical protein